MKWLHWLFCDWSKWKTTDKGTISNGGRQVGFFTHQERECKICEKIELRQEETY